MKHTVKQEADRASFNPAQLNELTRRQNEHALRVPGAAREKVKDRSQRSSGRT
jgi:hypothetical protein